jgi:uncharacterized repeat protein (TIGR01451 family)
MKQVAPREAAPGEWVVFVTDVRNAGTEPLTAIMLAETLDGPGTIERVSITGGRLEITGADRTWYLDHLGPGEAATIEIEVRIPEWAAGTLDSCGTVQAAEVGEIMDCERVLIVQQPTTAIELDVDAQPVEDMGGIAITRRVESVIVPSDIRYIGGMCLQVMGVTVTCIPFVRWWLLLVGILVAVLGFMLWFWRDERDETEENARGGYPF